MATLNYAKKAQYTLPALNWGIRYLDAIYLDGNLFKNNTPILDGLIRMDIVPTGATVIPHKVVFDFPTYQNGQVVIVSHQFEWDFGGNAVGFYDLYLNGHPYGMGLNIITVHLLPLTPMPNAVVYNVVYAFMMEV
jgi:hypothetical protein